jgi:PAS domain S-box-containing protein
MQIEMGRILIVDDEPAIRDCIGAALRKQGHETLLAENAAQGMALALEHVPELIISDICMEGGDGFSLLRSLRENARTGAIPFIIVTGHPDQEGMMKGFENAADGYLAKPLSLKTLLAAVESRLKREELVRRDASEIKTQLIRVLQASPDLIALIDPETRMIEFLNTAGERMLETEGQERRAITEYLAPAVVERFVGQAIPTAVKGARWTGETVLVAPSGRRVPVELVLQAHRRHDEKVEYMSIIARDLTERTENERALRASGHRFRCLVDALPDGVLMYDEGGQINFCNARAVQLLGYPPQELLGANVRTLVQSEQAEMERRAKTGERQEFKMARKDGEQIPVSIFREKLEIEGSLAELCIFHDLTERKRIERERQELEIQLRQAQKLESIGQLAAGIAHEINTPTQYIGDNTRFLKEAFTSVVQLLKQYQEAVKEAESGGVRGELLEKIAQAKEEQDLDFLLQEIPSAIDQSLEGIERVAKIVRAMKDFSHPNNAEKTAIDINHAIESTVTVTRNEWKYVANLETELDRNLPAVPCLPGEVNQVILNLIVNAAHAIGDAVRGTEEKGLIRVTTTRVGEWVEIRVADTGTGIPEQARSRIFEPFFTTKEVGKGTGQGLAITRSVVVDKHGGTITFETEVGKGTTFIVRIPLSP